MKHKRILITLVILAFFNCKNENKILGKWEGIRVQKMGISGQTFTGNYHLEFSNNNKGWEKTFDSKNGKPYNAVVFDYSLEGDSIFLKYKDKKTYSRYININTESKLILTSDISGTVNYFESNKTK